VTSSRFYLAPDACENGDLGIPQLTPSVSTPIPLQHPFPTTPVLLPKSIYESFCRVAEYRELLCKFIIKKGYAPRSSSLCTCFCGRAGFRVNLVFLLWCKHLVGGNYACLYMWIVLLVLAILAEFLTGTARLQT
jgi:hypothetical protein